MAATTILPDSKLHTLAARWGIASEYVDIFGDRRETSRETCQTLLAAMGIDLGHELKPCGDEFLLPGLEVRVVARV